MDPHHNRITEIALEAAAGYGFALAGGYAVSAHGMGHRLSGDVDLFTDWQSRGDFGRAVEAIIAAMEAHRYTVTVVTRADTFARLLLDDQSRPGAEPEKLELSADWRAHAPVLLNIGPVLHPDDAVANKMCALFGRAEARDFLDVDAAIQSGRYTREKLLELAEAADGGFDRARFAEAIGSLRRITDADFDFYGVTLEELTAVRARFEDWRTDLQNA
ncbi:nucleotidyl transferase AbiEii/AbiGii toxin family protein [Actinoplanes sp. NPDC051861]|uniref:nucleotidyl transferase AbiEii/AbiGii toxin family protein n=1 Tax=Actinoplanes sp. NPDC051861 TaxID=3155170 RepID=UPI00343A6E71